MLVKTYLKDIGFNVRSRYHNGLIQISKNPLKTNFSKDYNFGPLFDGCHIYCNNDKIEEMYNCNLKNKKIKYETEILENVETLNKPYIDYWEPYFELSEEELFYINLKYGDYFLD